MKTTKQVETVVCDVCGKDRSDVVGFIRHCFKCGRDLCFECRGNNWYTIEHLRVHRPAGSVEGGSTDFLYDFCEDCKPKIMGFYCNRGVYWGIWQASIAVYSRYPDVYFPHTETVKSINMSVPVSPLNL